MAGFFTLPPIKAVAYVGVGYVGTPMLEGFLAGLLPISMYGTTLGKYATRIASVLGLSALARFVLGTYEATMVGIGGGAYVLTSAVREFVPQLLPTGMAYYAQPTLRAYATPTGATYHPSHRMLGAPAFGARNTVSSAPFGGAQIVASRFRRFQ